MNPSKPSIEPTTGRPQATPMPGPTGPAGAAVPPEAMPMPGKHDGGPQPPTSPPRVGSVPEPVVLTLPDYPRGRGGMSTVPSSAGETPAGAGPVQAGAPITGRPPASEMPAVSVQPLPRS